MRHAINHGAHYLAVIVACLLAVTPLSRARWPRVAPGLGIAVWQALLLSLATSLTGLAWAIGLAPYASGEIAALGRFGADLIAGRPVPLGAGHVTAVAAGMFVAVTHLMLTGRFLLATVRRRWRHRDLLALVGSPNPAGPDVTLVDHPALAAYCLPGRRANIVVTAGAVRALSAAQLAAVLAHERTHAAERHDLVLLPFAALRRAFGKSRLVARMAEAVDLLVEMRADDRAATLAGRRHLRAALATFGAAPPADLPAGVLGAAGAVTQRVQRLARPSQALSRRAVAGIVGIALFVATTPLSLLALPW